MSQSGQPGMNKRSPTTLSHKTQREKFLPDFETELHWYQNQVWVREQNRTIFLTDTDTKIVVKFNIHS